MKLRDLKPNFFGLSQDETVKLMKETRRDRTDFQKGKLTRERKRAAKRKVSSIDKIKRKLAGIPKDELIKLLKGDDDEGGA